MKTVGPVLVLAAGFILGGLIWRLSPGLTGEVEAWDASHYYALSLFIAGLAAGVLSPRHSLLAAAGIYAGQIAYVVLFLDFSSMWVIGFAVALIFQVAAVAGSAVIFAIWNARRKK